MTDREPVETKNLDRPWHLYRLTFHTVFGVATEEPYGATRWRFER